MKTAMILADGEWHDIPDRPIRSIIAPIPAEIDLRLDGVGRVRWPKADDLRSLPVEYATGDGYRVSLSELQAENAKGWDHGR